MTYRENYHIYQLGMMSNQYNVAVHLLHRASASFSEVSTPAMNPNSYPQCSGLEAFSTVANLKAIQ